MRPGRRAARVRLAAAATAAWFGIGGAVSLYDSRPADANPAGGQVTAGTATIATPTPTVETINQSTQRAVIDWKSFNIAVGEKTQFVQPSASAMTLNRVLAADPSTIAGQLIANGSIVLVNPSGVVFSKGSQVNVNSIIATPTNISNSNFMAGNLKFDQPSPNPNASIVNAGTITVGERGLAALVAPSVVNSGVIQARLGKVVLGGAETYAIDLYGDGLISFDVGSNVQIVPLGPDGKPVSSLVSNLGQIAAAGGTVLLTADAAAGILASVIDSPGKISASTITSPKGVVTVGDVTLDAGAGNGAQLSGSIDVSGHRPGQTGGSAIVTGGAVELTRTASIKASGPAGGGTVAIGGGPHGQSPAIRNADSTTVETGALIDASATANGNGGTVSVWSDGTTVFNGAILAKGGPGGGDGGWVETSGHNLAIGAAATVTASAPAGKSGTWLLDPFNVEITDTTDGNSTSNAAGGTTTFSPTATGAQVAASSIVTALDTNNTNVVVTTSGGGGEAGDITVNGAITWISAHSLTLNADGSIAINATITGSNAGSGLVLTASAGSITIGSPLFVSGQISLNADVMSFGAQVGGSSLNTGVATNVTLAPATAGAAINVGVGSGGLALSPTDLQNDVFAATLVIGNSNTGKVSILSALDFTGAHVTNLTVDPAFAVLGADISTPGGQTYPDPVVLGANVTLTSTGGGNISFGGTIDSGTAAGTFGLTATTGGEVLFGGNVGTTTDVTTGAAGALKFLDATGSGGQGIIIDANVQTGTGNQTYHNAVALGGAAETLTTGGGAITFSGTIDGASPLTIAAGSGAITFGGDVGTGTPLSSLSATGQFGTITNAITTSGTLALFDTATAASLNIQSALTSTAGQVFLQSADTTDGVQINGAGGGVVTGTTVSVQADALALTGGGTIDAGAGTFEFAPKSSIAMGLGTGGLFTSTAGITAGTFRLGAVAVPGSGLTTTASSIAVASTVAFGGANLELDTTGTIDDGGVGQVTGVGTLTGTSSGGTTLNQSNQIATLGNFTNTGAGGFQLITATAPLTQTVGTTIDGGSGTIAINTTVQTFTQSGTLTTTNSGGSAVVLADIGTLTIGTITAASGEVALGTIGHTVGTVTETGTITASELAVESTSSVTLGQANVVSQLGTVTASGNFVFDNTAALEVLSGATVNAGAGTILIDNGGTALTLDATSLVETTATGSAVTLQNTAALGTNGAITASSGTVVLGTAGNTVGATVGAGTEVITADTLTGVSTGGVVLTGANAIANLGPYTPGGAFGLIEATNLTVNGTMSAGGSDVSLFLNRNPGLALTVSSPIFSTGQISLQADAMTFGAQIGGSGLGAGQASLVGVASATNPVNISLGGSATNGPGLLGLSAAELNEIHATDVKIVNVNGAINFDGAFTASPAFGTDLGTASPLATNGLYLLTGATGTIEIGGVLTLNGGLSALDTNITLNQSISTPGVQFYAGRIILGSSVTLSTANQLIDLDATIDATTSGAQGLTVNAGTGTVTFGAAVGTTALSTLSATGGAVQLNGGSVTTNGGGQSYTGPVTLGVGAILADTGGGNIALNGAVDGIRLTVNTLGTTTFGGAVGGTTPLASLTTDAGGATDLNGGTVHTTGAQTYSDAVMLGATTTLTSDISSSLTSAVTLASTVDGPFALTVNTSGQTEFDGAIGAINPLASLTTDAGGRTNLAAGTVKTTGAQTYNDSTDLLATTVLTSTGSGNITFATALLGGNDLTVSTAGTAIFGGTVSENSLNVSNASGSATIDANISTSGAQNYAGTATLGGAAITLNSTSGGANGAITFAGQVTGGGDSLTLTSGTGAVTLAGVDVGSAGNLAFTGTTGMLTLNGGTYTIAGSYAFPTATANGTLVLGDTGTTTFGALTLGSTATFRSGTPGGNNGGITFGAIDGQQMLTIDAGTGNVTLGGSVGNQFTPTSLQVNFGTLAINGGAVTTAGTQTYTATPGATDLVTLGSASTTLSTTNSLISFNSPISGSGDALTLTTGSGGLTLNGATLGSLVMNTTGPISLGGAVYDIDSPLSFPDAPTTLSGTTTLDSATTFAGPVTLTGNTTIDTGVNGIVFNNTITGQSAGGQSLTITGNGLVTFNGAIGGGGTPLASLTVSDPVINADMTTVGAQTYSTAVTLGTGTTPATFVLTTTNSPVSFGSTVDAATAGDQGLTVAAGTGAVTFGGPVGSQQALASLNVTGPTAIQANVISTGAQTYNSAVTLGVGATPATIALSTTNAAVDFVDRVDAATLQDQGLTVNAGAGTVTFGGAVGGLASLASLATTGGQVVIGGGQIMTAGAQAYTGSTGGIVLGAGTVLAASNSAISLNSPVTSLSVGGDALVLTNGSGGVTLDGATVASLTLTTIGPLSLGGNTYDIGDGTVPYTFPAVATSLNGTFSLGQPTIFNGGVTLGATTTLNTAANLTFNNAIDGNQDLTINAGAGLVTFNSEIGGLMPLASLTVSDPVLNAAVTTVGAQTYNSAVTLGTGITPTTILLTTTNAAVDFASTVDAATAGDQGLTVAVGTGTVTFGGAVGGGQKLATLTVTGGTIASNGAVATTGAQSYTNSAQLDLNGGTYTATNGAFTENGATTLGANTTIDTSAGPNNITFQTGGAITGTAFTLTMKAGTSTIALNGPVSTASQSYTDGNLDLNGGSYTAGGGFTESGLAVLGAPSTTIDTSTGNGPILFQGNGTIDGASALAMTSGTGAITVSGAIGGSAVLTSVTASGGVITLGNSTNTTGAQSYTDTTLKLAGPNYTTANGTFTETGATVLTGGTTIDTSAGNQAILFQGSGTIDGPVALGMSSGTGAITVGTIGGGAALGSVTASGGVITLGGSANTTGAQSYTDTTLKLAGPNYTTANGTFTETGATMLTVDTRIDTSAGPGAILFQGGGAIDGGFALALNSGTAATTVGGNVGVATPLASLTATGGTITLGGNAITTGAQGYTDTTLNLAGTMYETNANPTPAATFNQTGATNYTAGNVTIDTTGVGTSPAGANIGFVGSINGNGALAMNAGAIGTITLDGSVASGAGSQGYTDATLDLNGAIYTAGAGFTENGATVLTDDVTVNTLAGNGPILFQGAGTIDGDGVAGRN
ncbi:MAG TPA: filamentous hemagglutinin N-terminal domain-containing protein, partial [Stellaceae bacterium]|nr:filamentous hemagglutinin N-terminal domain-containing protein [Stellaceae bacterium]